MLCWKVVSYNPTGTPRFQSFNLTNDLKAFYDVGNTTYAHPDALAHGYGLCVFDSLANALEFLDGFKRFSVVLKCAGHNVLERLPPWGTNPSLEVLSRIRAAHNYWPPGTVMVEALAALEIYDPKEGQ